MSAILQHRRKAFRATGSPGTANLLAWWALDETGSPTTWVDSHSTFDLTKNGTVTSDASGKVAGAADFDAVEVEFLFNAAFNNTVHTTDFSVCGWFKFDDAGGIDSLIGQYGGSTATRHWFLQRQSGSDKITFRILIDTGSAFDASADAAYTTTGEWKFIVGVRESDVLTLYIDAVAQADTETVSGGENTTDQDLQIGKHNSTFNGQADECAIFDDALTQAEIDFLYNSGSGRALSDL